MLELVIELIKELLRMSNKFKDYGFIRKAFQELNSTGVKGESHKNIKYGYTRTFDVNEELSVTLNIIPQENEWICEREDFNVKIFDEISNYLDLIEENAKLFKEFQNFDGSRFDFALFKLNYTDNSYSKKRRWAYMDTKEQALEQVLFQYPYLFE